MARAWRTIARKVTPTALYWLVLSLITFLGMSAVIKIEATRTRLLLVVVVVVVAFSAAYFLERLLRDYVRTDTQPNSEPSDVWPPWCSQFGEPIVYRQSDHVPYSYVVLPSITGSLPKWLNRNKERRGAKDRGNGERRRTPNCLRDANRQGRPPSLDRRLL